MGSQNSEKAMSKYLRYSFLLGAVLVVIASVGVLRSQKNSVPVEAAVKVAQGETQPKKATDAVTSTALALPELELKPLQAAANAGDCQAALRVARHYSFGTNELEESVTWLRMAAKCNDADTKGQLIRMLLAMGADPTASSEIDRLLSEIRKLDIAKGREYEEVVAAHRTKKD